MKKKIIILSDMILKSQKQEQKMCNLLEAISIFLEAYFLRKIDLYFSVDPMNRLMAKKV